VAANCRPPMRNSRRFVSYVRTISTWFTRAAAPTIRVIKGKWRAGRADRFWPVLLNSSGLEAEYLLVHSPGRIFRSEYFDGEQFKAPAVASESTASTIRLPYMTASSLNHVPDFFQGQMACRSARAPRNRDKKEISMKTPGCCGRTPREPAENTTVEDYALTIQSTAPSPVTSTGGRGARGRTRCAKPFAIWIPTEEPGKCHQGLLTTPTEIDAGFFLVRISRADKNRSNRFALRINNWSWSRPMRFCFGPRLFAPISDLQGDIDAVGPAEPIKISYDQEYYKKYHIRYPSEWS